MKQKTLLELISIAVVAAVLLVSAQLMNYFLDALILAAVSAYIVYPLTRRIHKRAQKYKAKWARSYAFASVVSFLALIIPFVLIMFQTINVIGNPEGTRVFLDLLKYSPEISMKVKLGLDAIGLNAFSETLSGEIRELLLTLGSRFSRGMTQIASTMLVQVPIYLISTYYFIQDGPRVVARLKEHLSMEGGFLKEFLVHIDRMTYGILMGHFITSLIVGILAVIGFGIFYAIGILPLPSSAYVIFLGIITAVAALLPVIGAWFVFIPVALWIVTSLPAPTGVINAIIILVFGEFFLVLLPAMYIRPHLVGQRGKVHPLIVLIGFLGGTLLWGLKGFIIGPLALGLAQAVIETYFGDKSRVSEKYNNKGV